MGAGVFARGLLWEKLDKYPRQCERRIDERSRMEGNEGLGCVTRRYGRRVGRGKQPTYRVRRKICRSDNHTDSSRGRLVLEVQGVLD
jgi:hypothetical protein